MTATAPATTVPWFDVSGRTALVTGASRGIGRALAQGLLNAGVHVVLNGRDGIRLETTRAELAAESGPAAGTAHVCAFDVTDAEQVADGVARAEQLAGPLDILVNNAGMQARAPLAEFSHEQWDRMLALNLSSAFLVGQQVARRMIERGHGKIVNLGSLQCTVTRPGIAPYAATKGAIAMLTKGMCADWAGANLQINALAPGYIVTDLTRVLHEDPDFDAWVRGRTPAGRWGRVEDLIGTLLYLVSPASDFVNGQVVYVDGGMLTVL